MTDVHRCNLPLSAGVSLEPDSVTKKMREPPNFRAPSIAPNLG